MKVAVTVEMEFSTMPGDAAKELAAQIVEARGLIATRVAMVAAPKEGKLFQPKAGAAGSLKIVGGLGYTIWSDGPRSGTRWALRATEPDGLVYLLQRGGNGREFVDPYHFNGRRHNGYGECNYCPKEAVAS